MLQLCDEILLQTLKYLYYLDPNFVRWAEKDDLLATRAACRRLGNIGIGLAFEHLTVVHGERGYATFLQMSRRPYLCHSVQRLTFTFQSFEVDPTLEQFVYSRGISMDSNTPKEPNKLYQTYCHNCEHQKHLEESNVDIASLAAAIPQLRTLRSIRVLEDFGSWLKDWFVHDYHGYTRTGPRLFGAITSALYVSGLEIEELHLGSLDSDDPALIGIVQGLSSLSLLPYGRLFGRLRRLEMILPWMVDAEEVNYYGVTEVIQSSALAVEELSLGFDNLSYAISAEFFDSLILPHLQVLWLKAIEFQGSLHMMQFFRRHARTLKVVELCSINLESDLESDLENSWEPIFIETRNC